MLLNILYWVGGSFLISVVCLLVCTWIFTVNGNCLSKIIWYDLYTCYFKKLNSVSEGNIDINTSQKLFDYSNTFLDIQTLREAYSYYTPLRIKSCLMVIIDIALCFQTSWQLTFLILCGLILTAIAIFTTNVCIEKRAHKACHA